MLTLLLLACAPQIPLSPGSGSATGYYPVQLDLSPVQLSAEQVLGVQLGGVAAYDLNPIGQQSLEVMVQGAPQAGFAELVLSTADGELVVPDAFEVLPPVHPAFERVVAIGASLTQGVQAGVPSQQGALGSPSFLLARQAGAHHALPLLTPGLFPPIGPDAIGPAPDCLIPDTAGHVTGSATQVLAQLIDPDDGQIHFELAREDPDVQVYNLAVGGSNLGHLLRGPPSDDFALNFVTHLVYDPYSGPTDPILSSQIEELEALQPTLVMSTDLFGNDLISPVAFSLEMDPSRITPHEELREDMEELIERLDATGAWVLLATLPRPSLLPGAAENRRGLIAAAVERAREQGEDEQAAAAAAEQLADANLAQIEEAWRAANESLVELAGARERVVVVELAEEVERIAAEGLTVGDQQLSVGKLGGLQSVDGVHFTDVGYAMLANLFIEAANQAIGVQLEPVDLQAVLAGDPESPEALRAAGVEPLDCAR